MTAYLPPLPPLPGDAEPSFEPTGRKIIDVLADEHHEICRLSAELADEEAKLTPERERLAQVVSAMVSRHLSAEEQYLYPAVRKLLPNGNELADAKLAENKEMLRTLAAMETTPSDDPEFDRLAVSMQGYLEQHSHLAATDLHPALDEATRNAELIRLGNRVQIAEEAAPTRPHPDSPSTPPLNKVTDPALGVADKVRDVVQGRTTYPEDIKK
jgi:hypothetical protein